MANQDRFIVGDWGSTAMRLHLCERRDGTVAVIATRSGPGVKFCDDFEDAFFAATDDWFAAHGAIPVILAGMIGSNIGWVDCPYAPCPSDAAAFRARVHRFTARGIEIGIAPGLTCRNLFGLPDVMRGEEAQLFGLVEQLGPLDGRTLVCLPGTHGKWARVEGGTVASFFTSMQGEIFEVLLAHTLVGRGLPQAADRRAIAADDAEFLRGVDLLLGDATLTMELAVFATRSRFVTGALAAADAPAFLSGMLIACEIRDALNAHRSRDIAVKQVILVGADALMPLYAAVLERMGVATRSVPAHVASIAGLAGLALPQPARVA